MWNRFETSDKLIFGCILGIVAGTLLLAGCDRMDQAKRDLRSIFGQEQPINNR